MSLKNITSIVTRTFAIGLFLFSAAAVAQGNSQNAPGRSGEAPGNSGNAPGQSQQAPGQSGNASTTDETNEDNGNRGNGNGQGGGPNIGFGNASDGVMARIMSNRQVFVSGEDELEISIRFARGAHLVSSGEADAYIVLVDTEGNMSALGVLESEEELMEGTRIFQMDTEEVASLPVGDYQLGLVLSQSGEDPFLLHKWYNGMLGLLDVRPLTIAASSETENDENGDETNGDETNGDETNGDDEEDDTQV